MRNRTSCSVCYETICDACGLSLVPVISCVETKSGKGRKKGHK